VTDPAVVARVAAHVGPSPIIIADGHSPLRDGARLPAPSAAARGRRLGARLPHEHGGRGARHPADAPDGAAAARSVDAAALEARLREGVRARVARRGAAAAGAIDVVLPDRRWRLRAVAGAAACLDGLSPALRALDVSLLHKAILEPILGLAPTDLAFTHDDAEALEAVAAGRAEAAFLLNPPTIQQVEAVCLAGELMPEKFDLLLPEARERSRLRPRSAPLGGVGTDAWRRAGRPPPRPRRSSAATSPGPRSRFVALVDYMGSDEDIERAARVSYGYGTRKTSQTRGLIRYLRRHRHTTPSEMVELKFHCAMPVFVARQWIRHRTASINEYSGRYSLMPLLYYRPDPEQLAVQSAANRAGAGGRAARTPARRRR